MSKWIVLIPVFLAAVFEAATLEAITPRPPVEQESSWEEFKSYEGKFRILTPGPFREKVDTIETQVGLVAHHTYFYQAPEEQAENLFYMVSYFDYPPAAVHSDSTELLKEFFSATISAAVNSVRGDLIYADDIRLEGYPGKLWRIHYLDGKAVIKTKAFVVGSRYYSVQTIMYRNMSLNPASEKFLDSFRLLN